MSICGAESLNVSDSDLCAIFGDTKAKEAKRIQLLPKARLTAAMVKVVMKPLMAAHSRRSIWESASKILY